MNTATRKLAFIHEHLAAGRTIYIATALKAWKLSKKHAAMVKVSGESIYLQRGKNWDCIDYCQISAE